jgi:cysteine desulfurase
VQDTSRKVYSGIYLDANASERLRPEAREAVLAALELAGNPASIHAAGRAARRVLEESRAVIGAAVGAAATEVTFCSGGTEANAMAIASLGAGRRVLVGATEHDAVRANAPGAEVLPVRGDGTLDLAALEATLQRGPASLVCIMLANNETGVLHPVVEVAALCRAHGARLHVDAVQALGRVTVDRGALGADSLALSGHKVGGPKGAGALVHGPGVEIRALIAGGGQERGRRGGTPGLPAVAGFAAAARAACDGNALPGLRDRMEAAAVASGAVVCGGGARLGNTTCLALPGIRAETQVIALDLAGIAVSAGAACSSGKVTESHVLAAMGLGALASCAIRVSLPWNASEADADMFILTYRAMADRLRASQAAA